MFIKNVLQIELLREFGNSQEYKIIYDEEKSTIIRLTGRKFYYDETVSDIPYEVLKLAQMWILEEI